MKDPNKRSPFAIVESWGFLALMAVAAAMLYVIAIGDRVG